MRDKSIFCYDATGNQTKIGYPDGTSVTKSYDLVGNLERVVETDGRTTTYEYDGLDYRYVYGLNGIRLSVTVKGVPNGAGHIIENGDEIRLYYHQDLRGTVDYLTSPVSGKVESWTHYNEWGEITHNAVLKCGQRELDMVKNYTGHEYDQVLGVY